MVINGHSSGKAGSPYSPLQPSITSKPRFGVGPFGAELRPTLSTSQRRAYSMPLQLGLIVSLPDVDGNGAVELTEAGYCRQDVALVAFNLRQLAVVTRVLFQDLDGREVKGLGLYNKAGELEGFGALRAYTTSEVAPSCFEFPAFQVLVRRVRTTL